jgi:hypothetical protein
VSGILNEFGAEWMKYSVEESTVYLDGLTFKYSLFCIKPLPSFNMHFFFNLESGKCLLTMPNGFISPKHRCWIMSFWLEEDLPILSARLFEKQEYVVAGIHDEFREKYAAILLDGIINKE